MSYRDRMPLIRAIETARDSVVLTYVTGTRPNLEFPMAMDAIRRLYDHIEDLHVPRMDLFIHSNGGDGVVPWRLVTLLREYCDHLAVLVPHRAFSAATLTALGADEIVMHAMGMLGPTDPTVANSFNPRDGQGNVLGIGVEDVAAFLAVARDDLNLSQEGLVKTLEVLARRVHPLALGNVKRSQSQSRMMAQKLLCLHMDPERDRSRMDAIVDSLTSKLYFHGHPINRTEAAQLGLNVSNPGDQRVDSLMWDLYLAYEADMELSTAFRPTDMVERSLEEAGEQATSVVTGPVVVEGIRIESTRMADLLRRRMRFHGQRQGDGSLMAKMMVIQEEWTREQPS